MRTRRPRFAAVLGAAAAAAAAAAATLINVVAATPARADVVRDGQWYLGALGVTEAQSLARGTGVRVAVIDSGVDGSVADLAGAVVAGKDFSGTGSANGQQPIDGSDHGTNVASLLAGRGHGNGAGVIGVAPCAELPSASVDGTAQNNQDQVVSAVRWSVANGAKVINVSSGGSSSPAQVAAFRYAQSKDVVIVGASGNNGDAQAGGVPCTLPGVVCVGGVDKDLQHDPEANTDPHLTIVGPYATRAGASKSTDQRAGLPAAEPATSSMQYVGASGTSLAAPIVAGTIALIRQKYPNLDAANVVNRLIKTATPAGSGTPNSTYGYGIVDAEKALTASVPMVQSNPLGSLTTSTTAPGSSTAPGTRGATGNSSSSVPPIGKADDGGQFNTGIIVGIVVATLLVGGLTAYAVLRRRRASAGSLR